MGCGESRSSGFRSGLRLPFLEDFEDSRVNASTIPKAWDNLYSDLPLTDEELYILIPHEEITEEGWTFEQFLIPWERLVKAKKAEKRGGEANKPQDLKDKLKEILTATPLTFKMPMQTLDENCDHALARCVEKMAEHPQCGVRIVCSTENPAGIWESSKLCKDLALFRAHAVKQALVMQGATNVITCVGLGANGACTCIIEEVDMVDAVKEEQKLSCAHLVFKNPATNADMEVLFEKRPLGFEFNRTAPITISKVDRGSHGDEKGVKEGWIIERINDTSFTYESNFQEVYDVLVKALRVCPADGENGSPTKAPPPPDDLKNKLKEILTATPLTFKMPMQTLDESCNQALAQCVEKMAEHPESGVRILCTTENPAGIWGSAKLCKDLALFRAHAVKQALVLQGATNIIICVGAGANGTCKCIIEEVDVMDAVKEEQKLSCAHLVFKNPETNADMEVLFEKRPLGFEFNKTAPITITKVDPGSHGEEKGVKEGWIIERINDTTFTNESNFQAVYDVLIKAVKGLPDGDEKMTV